MKIRRANPRSRPRFIRCVFCCGALLLALSPASLRAGDDPPPGAASQPAAPHTSAGTDPYSQLENQIKALGDKGALFQFIYTGEEFADISGGMRRGADYEGLLKITLTLDLKNVAGWNGATFYASVLYPHGNGITNKYVGDYNVVSSIDAYDTFRLSETWIQQKFYNDKFTIRAGYLVTDNNFFVSDNGALYINSAYGVVGTILHDVNPPIYPLASPGVHLRYDPAPSFYLQAMVVGGDPGTEDGNNRHGVRFDLRRSGGALGFAEAGYKIIPEEEGSQPGGSYKLGGFYDTAFYQDNSGGAPHHGDYGVYAVVDQQLCCAPGSTKDCFQGLSAFSRISCAPGDRNPVFFSLDSGLNYTGLLPGHPKDILGIAFALEKLSDKLRQPSGAPVPSHRENVLEATYLANLNDWFSMQPDLQYIVNPGGFHTTRNAVVAGIRFNISF